jgi:hypothetical protein
MPFEVAGKFKTEGANITASAAGASAQVIYTCPNNFSAIVRLLNVASGTVANKHISVQFYHSENATYYYLLRGYDMGAASSFNVLNAGIMSLHQKDKLVAFANSSGNFDIIVSVEEYFDPVRK